MENDTSNLTEKAQGLGDLELAVLLCLITGEHCIIEADAEALDQAEQELQSVRYLLHSYVLDEIWLYQICAGTFAIKNAVLHCSKDTTLDDFDENILIHEDDPAVTPIHDTRDQGNPFFSSRSDRQHRSSSAIGSDDEQRIADVVIARNLHLAPQQVQIQALEVIEYLFCCWLELMNA